MKRIWIVDDNIPVREIYQPPFPDRIDTAAVEHMVQEGARERWGDDPLLALCRSVCVPEFDSTFFLTPEALVGELKRGATAPHAVIPAAPRPPHAVIFDWEYLVYTPASNIAALERILASSFTYVQIYTHIGAAAVEPLLGDLRARFGPRLLPAKSKSEVTADQLALDIRDAWKDSIAGDLADEVRLKVSTAVEHSLIDMSEIRRGNIAALTQGEVENLVQIVLSKIRDEIGPQGSSTMDILVSSAWDAASSDRMRQLLSIWYFSFPSDDLVRRGDIVEIDGMDGELGFVLTPPCDLTNLPKKAGRRLTWLRIVPLNNAGLAKLRKAGIKMKKLGNSIVADHQDAGQTIVLLPNVPSKAHSRGDLGDFALLCHAWENREITGELQGPLKYSMTEGVRRRCTLTEPFASAVVAKVAAVISSPGTPDLPKGEIDRLTALLAAQPANPQ